MNYSDALNLILSKQRLGIKPGLSRVEKLLGAMGDPQNNLKIIHVAGTNGKGTVANAISNALTASGFKTGLFTSPWVTDYREQIQIDNAFISESAFAEYVNEFGECESTEFELLTAIMYKYFSTEKVDYAVVECGMGGLGDSTNAIEKSVLSVITSVSIDHTDFLGATLEEIAVQKAGIIKQNGICVLYPNKKCENVFEKKCIELNARLVKVRECGNYQLNNLSTANAALKELGLDIRAKIPVIPARTEMINGILLDGAHNADGAAALKSGLPNGEIAAIIGMMEDKDISGYLSVIAPLCSMIITVKPLNPRAMDCKRLAAVASAYCNNVVPCENISDALALLNTQKCFKLICGSFYLARDIRKMLLNMS